MADQIGHMSPEDREQERLDDTWRGPYAGYIPGATITPIDSAPSAPAQKKQRSTSASSVAPQAQEVRIAGANDPKPDWRYDEETISLGYEGIEVSRGELKSPTNTGVAEEDATARQDVDPETVAGNLSGVALARSLSAQVREERIRPKPTPAPTEVTSEATALPPPPRPPRP